MTGNPTHPTEQQLMNDLKLADSLYVVVAGFYHVGNLAAMMAACQAQRDLQIRIISTASGIRKFPFDLEQFLDQDYKSIRLLREEHQFPQPFLHMVFKSGSCTVRLQQQVDQWDMSNLDFFQCIQNQHINYSDKQDADAQYQLAKLMDESYLLTISELNSYQQAFREMQITRVCA